MSSKHKSFRGRVYISHKRNQLIEDACLEYKSIPMGVANEMLKADQIKSKNPEFAVKHIYRTTPARPQNISAMALSIANLSGQPVNKVYDSILSKIANEERTLVKDFVDKRRPDMRKTIREGFTSKWLERYTENLNEMISAGMPKEEIENYRERKYTKMMEGLKAVQSGFFEGSEELQGQDYNEIMLGLKDLYNDIEAFGKKELESYFLGNEPIVSKVEVEDWIKSDRATQASMRSFQSSLVPETEFTKDPDTITRYYPFRHSRQIFPTGEFQKSSIGDFYRDQQALIRSDKGRNIPKVDNPSQIRRAYRAGDYVSGLREEPPKNPLKTQVQIRAEEEQRRVQEQGGSTNIFAIIP